MMARALSAVLLLCGCAMAQTSAIGTATTPNSRGNRVVLETQRVRRSGSTTLILFRAEWWGRRP